MSGRGIRSTACLRLGDLPSRGQLAETLRRGSRAGAGAQQREAVGKVKGMRELVQNANEHENT